MTPDPVPGRGTRRAADGVSDPKGDGTDVYGTPSHEPAVRDDKADAANAPEATAAREEDRRHATLHDDVNTRVAFLRAAETLSSGDSLRGLWFVCQRTGMLHVVYPDGATYAAPGDNLALHLTATQPSPDVMAGDGRTSRERVTDAMRTVIASHEAGEGVQPLDEALYDAVLASLTDPNGV